MSRRPTTTTSSPSGTKVSWWNRSTVGLSEAVTGESGERRTGGPPKWAPEGRSGHRLDAAAAAVAVHGSTGEADRAGLAHRDLLHGGFLLHGTHLLGENAPRQTG